MFYHDGATLLCNFLAIVECFHGEIVGKLARIHVQNLSEPLFHIATRTQLHHVIFFSIIMFLRKHDFNHEYDVSL